jgi:hypothetical protein
LGRGVIERNAGKNESCVRFWPVFQSGEQVETLFYTKSFWLGSGNDERN